MGIKTGEAIKAARTGAKLTQTQLAAQLSNVTASDISKAERGEKELTKTALREIAKITGVTQTSLLNAESGNGKKTETAVKTGGAKKTETTGKTESAKKTEPTGKTESAKKEEASKKTEAELKLTATEKDLIALYRKANSDTKKSVMSLLKGEKTESQELIENLIGGALSMLGGKREL